MSRIGDDEVNAATVFKSLEKKQKRMLLDRFDYWIGGGTADHYFHGWPNIPKYKDCFVFKWKHNNKFHRLYGFLYNPQPIHRPRFRLCVLVSHAIKKQWETDPRELDGANALRIDLAVLAAVGMSFPDIKAGAKQCLN